MSLHSKRSWMVSALLSAAVRALLSAAVTGTFGLVPRAAAAEPVPEPVAAVTCARPLRFESPHPWNWSAEHTPVTEVSVLVVQAEAALLAPRDVGQPILYVEGWPAEVLWTGEDRALVLAPVVGDLGRLHVWFGDTTLPERVDAAHRELARSAARDLPPRPPTWTGSALEWPATGGRDALVATLKAWMNVCGTGADDGHPPP